MSDHDVEAKECSDLFSSCYWDLLEHLDLKRRYVQKDITVVARRSNKEGVPFFYVTLPQLGEFFLSLLSGNNISQRAFCTYGNSVVPRFLGAITSRIFEKNGDVRTDVHSSDIRGLFQLLFMFKKYKKREDVKDALKREQSCKDSFVRSEQIIAEESNVPRILVTGAGRVIKNVFYHAPDKIDWVYDPNIFPGNGPGATFPNEKLHKRFLPPTPNDPRVGTLPISLNPMAGFSPNRDPVKQLPDGTWDGLQESVGTIFVNKFITVPKTSTKDRGIAPEHRVLTFLGKGVTSWLYPFLEKECPLTSGQINFTDQSVNQSLTRAWRTFATIDLSQASDLIPFWLIKRLFSNTLLYDPLTKLRSKWSYIDEGDSTRLVELKKFATMGNVLTFPVMSLTFFSICVDCIQSLLMRSACPCDCSTYEQERYRQAALEHAASIVFVYGDDIIVPKVFYAAITKRLEAFGFIINSIKSYSTGKFRESCGSDCFDGKVVTPIKIKSLPIFTTLKNACMNPNPLSSYLEAIHLLNDAGYRYASAYLESRIPYRGKLPRGERNSSSICLPLIKSGCIDEPCEENGFVWSDDYQCWCKEGFVLKDNHLSQAEYKNPPWKRHFLDCAAVAMRDLIKYKPSRIAARMNQNWEQRNRAHLLSGTERLLRWFISKAKPTTINSPSNTSNYFDRTVQTRLVKSLIPVHALFAVPE